MNRLGGGAARPASQRFSGTSRPLLVCIESISEQIREYNERIEKLAQENYPQVALLKQIKGVGTLPKAVSVTVGNASWIMNGSRCSLIWKSMRLLPRQGINDV